MIIGSWRTPKQFVGKTLVLPTGLRAPKPNTFNQSAMNYQMQWIRRRIHSFFKRYGDIVAIGMCLRFSVAAAKYTPPKNRGKWAASIQNSMYFRPIQDLRLLAKGYYPRCHASRQDYQMLRQGYLYRVMNTKYRHKRQDAVVAYAKGINQAKRLSRIQNRGISKYSWGSMINNIKEDIAQLKDSLTGDDVGTTEKPKNVGVYRAAKLPPIFQRLAKKSPNITKYQWGSYDWKYVPNVQNVSKINFTITNRLTQIERYGQIAIKQGLKAAEKYAKKIWSSIGPIASYRGVGPNEEGVSQQRQQAQKLRRALAAVFNDEVNKYGIEQLYLEREYKGQQLKGTLKDIDIMINGQKY